MITSDSFKYKNNYLTNINFIVLVDILSLFLVKPINKNLVK